MKRLDENELRIAARAATKTITSLGSPWGPNEAFVAGAKHAEKEYVAYLYEFEAELASLKKQVAKLEGAK